VVLQSSLAAQAEQLQCCIARFESFLERTDATLSRLSLRTPLIKSIPMLHSPGEVGVGSTEVKGADVGTSDYPSGIPDMHTIHDPMISVP
jgi:hypothetical protein